MIRPIPAALAAAAVVFLVVAANRGTPAQSRSTVEIRHDRNARAFVVSLGGQHFTSYRYGPEFADKPVFYPVVAPNGVRVNREYPMVEKVPGESADHPHHQSLFFAYDEVNGTNFWNPDKSGRAIAHVTAEALSGSSMAAALAWTNKDQVVVLHETRRVSFGGEVDRFWMTHDITLTARVPVTMGDTKEGAFAIRLNDALKEAGGSGRYINAEGQETAANVWGKTSDWVAIRGTVPDGRGPQEVTVAIFAARSSRNSPPYWHARDYGLFSVNPFGRKSFDGKEESRITQLAVGEGLNLRFQLGVYAGKVTQARLARDYAVFNGR